MHLRQVGLTSYDPATMVSDVCNIVDGITVWLPYGWYARLLLADVTGREFAALEGMTRKSRTISFKPGYESYNYRAEEARIEIHDREYIKRFVLRGALWDKNVMHELGRTLFRRLEDGLRNR